MPHIVQHRLFLGFRPPRPVVAEFASIRDAFPSRRQVPDDQLHMTLLPFPLVAESPERLARQIIDAVSAVELTGCRVIVDRLVLAPRSGLLQPSEPVRGLLSFQRSLTSLVLKAGLRPREGHRFSPHFTLFYHGPVRSCSCIDPVSWVAEELVLIHSFHGERRHETLERWPLTNPA
jgi:2'-5' RNA ligase